MQTIPRVVSVAFLTAGLLTGARAATMATPPVNPMRLYQAVQAKQMIVSANSGAELREEPADGGKIIERLVKGTKVTVVSTVTNKRVWAHVHVSDTWGYIAMQLLRLYHTSD
jgi:hypothetical protein